MMRTEAEVKHATSQLKDSLNGAVIANDRGAVERVYVLIKCCEWFLGSNAAGGFGSLIAKLDAVDVRRKAKNIK